MLLSSLRGRNKPELEKVIRYAKDQLSEQEVLSEIAPKLRDKIRAEVELKIKEKKENLNKKTEYEVPKD